MYHQFLKISPSVERKQIEQRAEMPRSDEDIETKCLDLLVTGPTQAVSSALSEHGASVSAELGHMMGLVAQYTMVYGGIPLLDACENDHRAQV